MLGTELLFKWRHLLGKNHTAMDRKMQILPRLGGMLLLQENAKWPFETT